MVHLTLQEVIDRVNNNNIYCDSTSGLKGERHRGKGRPHSPEFYVPRVTRMLAGFVFGAFRAADRITIVEKASTPSPVSS
jgi:hypothetical protein